MPEWDRDSLQELRAVAWRRDPAAIRRACAARPLDDVLQLVGDALLEDRESPLARECVERLRRRGLDGDAELADALEDKARELRPIAVDLEELASVLEGDPLRGGGRIDLATGEIWHESPYDDPLELTRFHRFADERQRGRARRWLADHGLRPTG